MPLVHAGAGPAGAAPTDGDEARVYARKIRPEFSRGELVRVAGGRNQAEAELIRGMLIEDGVPSMLRRSAGFDVPDFLGGGPRDVMVPLSGAEYASARLAGSQLAPPAHAAPPRPIAGRAARIAAVVVGAGALGALLAWAAFQAAG